MRKTDRCIRFSYRKVFNSWRFRKLWKQSRLFFVEVLLNPRSPVWHDKSPWPEIQSCLYVAGEVAWRMACKHLTMFHQAFFSLCQAQRLKTSMQRLTLGTLLCSIIQWLLLRSCGEHSSVTDEHPEWASACQGFFFPPPSSSKLIANLTANYCILLKLNRVSVISLKKKVIIHTVNCCFGWEHLSRLCVQTVYLSSSSLSHLHLHLRVIIKTFQTSRYN